MNRKYISHFISIYRRKLQWTNSGYCETTGYHIVNPPDIILWTHRISYATLVCKLMLHCGLETMPKRQSKLSTKPLEFCSRTYQPRSSENCKNTLYVKRLWWVELLNFNGG